MEKYEVMFKLHIKPTSPNSKPLPYSPTLYYIPNPLKTFSAVRTSTHKSRMAIG